MAANRYIPISIKKQLLAESRNRCCIHGHILFDMDTAFPEMKYLDKHHIHYLSESGKNEADNLIVVCANCHRNIHSYPALYTQEKLHAAKKFWRELCSLLPGEMVMPGGVTGEELQAVAIKILTLNLYYKILFQKTTSLETLKKFISVNILEKLARHCSKAPFPLEFSKFNFRSFKLIPSQFLIISDMEGDSLQETDTSRFTGLNITELVVLGSVITQALRQQTEDTLRYIKIEVETAYPGLASLEMEVVLQGIRFGRRSEVVERVYQHSAHYNRIILIPLSGAEYRSVLNIYSFRKIEIQRVKISVKSRFADPPAYFVFDHIGDYKIKIETAITPDDIRVWKI